MKEKDLVWIFVLVSLLSGLSLGLIHSVTSFEDESVYSLATTLALDGRSCQDIGTASLPMSTPCNYEHPPLVKLLDYVTFSVFGPITRSSPLGGPAWLASNFLSFRLVQVVMGAFSLLLIYYVAYNISGNKRLAVLASFLLLLDPLYAFFARTDLLDVPMVFFALCGYAIYFGSVRLGPLNEYVLSGVAFALSILSKETAVVFLFPVIIYHLLFRRRTSKRRLGEILTVVGVATAVSAAGLQLYDSLTSSPFPTFLDHVSYMLDFSRILSCPVPCNGPGPVPAYLFLTSFYWWDNLDYNLVLAWLLFAWAAVGAFLLWRARGTKVNPENRLFVFAALLLGSTLAENGLIYWSGRAVWIWYFLPVLPSLALGGAYLLTRREIPVMVRASVGVLVLVGYFCAYLLGPGLLTYD